jgi:hypothetical protein
VTVYEREASVDERPRDWTILIHWAMPILSKLLPDSVLTKLPDAICNPNLEFNQDIESLPCFNGVTGEILFRNPTPGARRVTRQLFRKILTEGLNIQWGKKLSQLGSTSDSVQLTFEDGDTTSVDYVLGTDGASSKVRELIVGSEAAQPKLSGFMFATGIVNYGDSEKHRKIIDAHPVAAIMMGTSSVGGIGGRYFSTYAVPLCFLY